MRKVAQSPRGGWIRVEYQTGQAERWPRVAQGELVAVDKATLYVLDPQDGPVAIPVAWITRARLAVHTNDANGLGVWGVLGTASAASHGWYAVLTVPVLWLPAAIGVPVGESKQGLVDCKGSGCWALWRWARFPQGLPPGVSLDELAAPVSLPPGGKAAPEPQP